MSAKDKLQGRSAANRQRLSAAGAGGVAEGTDALSEPGARLEALGSVGQTTVRQRSTGALTQPRRATARTTAAGVVGERGETLLTTLTTRATRGAAANEKINVVINKETLGRLEECETVLYRTRRIKLVRAALVSAAAQRVTERPHRYADARSAGSTAVLGSRIPAEVFEALTDVTYTATPRLAYGPLVGTAMGEIVEEVFASLSPA